MKDTCTKVMDRFLELDKNEHLPVALTLHLLSCKKCRTQVRLLSLAEKAAAEPVKIPVPLNDSSIEAVLAKIHPAYASQLSKSPISLCKWIISGLLMILLLLAFGVITNHAGSGRLLVAFYLMFAAIVTGYCALFVGCN